MFPSSVDPKAGPALLLLNVVAANIRNCVWPTSRLRSLELLRKLSSFLTDEDVINRVVPYALTALVDDLPHVRGAACQALIDMVRRLHIILILIV
jgi:phosphoinositide-3-kinase regulatory subunit 4